MGSGEFSSLIHGDRCSPYSDLVLGPVGTFMFVFGWVGY